MFSAFSSLNICLNSSRASSVIIMFHPSVVHILYQGDTFLHKDCFLLFYSVHASEKVSNRQKTPLNRCLSTFFYSSINSETGILSFMSGIPIR
jgi:hypothetical protein